MALLFSAVLFRHANGAGIGFAPTEAAKDSPQEEERFKKMSNTKIQSRSVVLAAAVAVLALVCTLMMTGCGSSSSSSSEDKTITIAACSTPHAEILNDVVAGQLEEEGYTLNVVETDDYTIPNRQLEDGEVNANYFQHKPYLEQESEERGYNDLVSIAAIHFEPFGIYAGTKDSLDDIAKGDKIAVPNDTTNEARALLLLQQEGLIELDPDAGIEATVKDITSNPLDLDIQEVAAEQTTHVRDDVAFACINANYALEAGLKVGTDALATENADGEAASTYANLLVVKSEDQDSDWAKALAAALTSDETKQYIEEKYEGSVKAVF